MGVGVGVGLGVGGWGGGGKNIKKVYSQKFSKLKL